jgi:hypothetical protein
VTFERSDEHGPIGSFRADAHALGFGAIAIQRRRATTPPEFVEVGMWVAGPAGAAILGDWGADVIKIEPAEGDPFRALLSGIVEGVNPPFELDNRNKRSVGLNLATEEGRALAAEIVDGADVFARLRDGLGAQPAPRLRARHGLRVDRRRRRPRRVRRRRVLVTRGRRRRAHARRLAAPLSAWRHG